MDRLDLWGTFMLGLLGTGHCIGMCGPLIFAFPGRTGKFMPHVWYHLGRITTYTAVGAIMGGLGQMLAGAATGGSAGSLGGVALIKAVLWLVAAALLMLFGVTRLGVIREPGWLTALSPERIPGFKGALKGATEHPGTAVFYFLGMILGFLPCGLSYGAFAQALGTGNAAQGTLLVLSFSVGTMPGLILLGTGASAIFSRYRRQSDILSGVVMILMALKMGHKVIGMVL
jgi:sulfite exporter TauE/SafE